MSQGSPPAVQRTRLTERKGRGAARGCWSFEIVCKRQHMEKADQQAATVRSAFDPNLPCRASAHSGKFSPRVSAANGMISRPTAHAIAVKAIGVSRVPMEATAPARPKFTPVPRGDYGASRPVERVGIFDPVQVANGARRCDAKRRASINPQVFDIGNAGRRLHGDPVY